MKDEDIDRMFAAMDKAVKPFGYERFDEFIREYLSSLEETRRRLTNFQDRERLRELYRAGDNSKPIQLEEVAQQLPGSEEFIRDWFEGKTAVGFEDVLKTLPSLVPALRPYAIAGSKQIPHAPGGRPESPVHQKHQQICEEVAGWYAKGVKLKIAFTRVGKQHGASATTIERIWHKRKGRSDALEST